MMWLCFVGCEVALRSTSSAQLASFSRSGKRSLAPGHAEYAARQDRGGYGGLGGADA